MICTRDMIGSHILFFVIHRIGDVSHLMDKHASHERGAPLVPSSIPMECTHAANIDLW